MSPAPKAAPGPLRSAASGAEEAAPPATAPADFPAPAPAAAETPSLSVEGAFSLQAPAQGERGAGPRLKNSWVRAARFLGRGRKAEGFEVAGSVPQVVAGAAGSRREIALSKPVPGGGSDAGLLESAVGKKSPAAADRNDGWEDKPALSWPRPVRYGILALMLGALSAAPPLLYAGGMNSGGILGVGALGSWPLLIGLAAVVGVAGIPLRIFAHRLAPWIMRSAPDEGEALMKKSPWKVVPLLMIGAASEEILFRGLIFLTAASLLIPLLSGVGAVAAAAFGSSLAFSLIHRYGPVWTRVVGGLVYCAALVLGGTLLLPILAHFIFNLTLYLRELSRRVGPRT